MRSGCSDSEAVISVLGLFHEGRAKYDIPHDPMDPPWVPMGTPWAPMGPQWAPHWPPWAPKLLGPSWGSHRARTISFYSDICVFCIHMRIPLVPLILLKWCHEALLVAPLPRAGGQDDVSFTNSLKQYLVTPTLKNTM